MKLHRLWATMAVLASAALLALIFCGYGAVGSIWLLKSLPGCG